MATEQLPPYLASAQPNPPTNRAPWYKNTAQTYAGIFLWIAFYDQLAGTAGGPGTLGMSGLAMCLLALVAAGLVSHGLFYVVPGMLGMKTGLPLYIVGTSTFGTKGGYFLPGIFMGLLQIGWYSVATFFATKLVLGATGMGQHDYTLFGPPGPTGNGFSVVFVVMAVVWGYLFAFLGGLGIGVVARISTYFPIVPIAMLILSLVFAAGHLGDYDREKAVQNSLAAVNKLNAAEDAAVKAAKALGKPDDEAAKAGTEARTALAKQTVSTEDIAVAAATVDEAGQSMISGALKMAGFLLMIQLVVGFFATAGACGADFCSNNRNANDVQMGGLVGVALATLFAGGLAVITVAGSHGALLGKVADGTATWGQLTAYNYSDAIGVIAPTWLGKAMLLLFAIGSVAPACFCSFIIGNSLSTMLAKPQARVAITMAGATIGIVLAALGFAGNLAPFFGLIGASFGPVIGAMTADYLLSGKRWPGPREGVSVAGYGAWLIGFLVGISNHPWVGVLPGWHPTGVYSMIVGFVVYAILASAGLQGKTVPFAGAQTTEPGSGGGQAI